MEISITEERVNCLLKSLFAHSQTHYYFALQSIRWMFMKGFQSHIDVFIAPKKSQKY